MKMIKNIIEYLIAISAIPAIVLVVISVTELKDVRNVQFELLSEEEGIFNVTPNTYEKLVANKRIKNYELQSNYPLITQEEMDRATWYIGDLKNEIYIDENGEKRIRLNVGQVTFDGSDDEVWVNVAPEVNHSGYYAMSIGLTNAVRENIKNSYNVPIIYDYEAFKDATEIIMMASSDGRLVVKLPATNQTEFKKYLAQNPLTITYELAIKNPNTKIIEDSDILRYYRDFNHIDVIDFKLFPDQKIIIDGRDTLHKIFIFENITEVTYNQAIDENFIPDNNFNWYVRPSDGGFSIVVPKGYFANITEAINYFKGKYIIYELVQPRPVEVYDFSKFRLVFHKNRIRVIFDIDDGYYLWEITKDDKMIPINGQYDLGNIWTVKFYVYEIQQPMIRSLVLLIPIIVISGILIYMYNIIKKKGISY